jgi:hypothetical protein
MTELDRYNILEILLIPRTEANQAKLWARLDSIQSSPVLESEVLRIMNLLLQADADPSVLLPPAQGTAQSRDRALTKVDVLEWDPRLKADEAARLQNLRDRLWLKLKNLIPWNDSDCCGTGLGFGFS